MQIKIKYKDHSDQITEREISDLKLFNSFIFQAFCHLRQERRDFTFSGVISAKTLSDDVETNRHDFFGIPRPTPKPTTPIRTKPPTTAEAKQIRGKDKRELYKAFRLRVLAESAKLKLFALFGNQCFNCPRRSDLQIDHNIPLKLGGRLVPGNLVVLCTRCNSEKLDVMPEQFYPLEKLQFLEAKLEKQKEIFNFAFDHVFWEKDKRGYLVSVGVPIELIDEALNVPESRFFVGDGDDDSELRYTIQPTEISSD